MLANSQIVKEFLIILYSPGIVAAFWAMLDATTVWYIRVPLLNATKCTFSRRAGAKF